MKKRLLRWNSVFGLLAMDLLILYSGITWVVEWEDWMMGTAGIMSIVTSGLLPLYALYKALKLRHAQSPAGFVPGDKVLVNGQRGVLVSHPLEGTVGGTHDRVKVNKAIWVVKMEDGSTRDDVHDRELKKVDVVSLLGDIVRFVRA